MQQAWRAAVAFRKKKRWDCVCFKDVAGLRGVFRRIKMMAAGAFLNLEISAAVLRPAWESRCGANEFPVYLP